MSSDTSFSWDVDLPSSKDSSFGKRKPKAFLKLETKTHGLETIPIVAAVGRSLIKERDSYDFDPSSRAELLQRIRELSERQISRKVENLINRRDYSSRELEEKLLSEGYRKELVDEQLKRAKEYKLVDDRRFAELFIRSKLSAGWGKRKIVMVLEKKGIGEELYELDDFEEMSADEQYERALELARKRRLSGKNDYEKIVRYLASRGYDFALAKRVALERLDEFKS